MDTDQKVRNQIEEIVRLQLQEQSSKGQRGNLLADKFAETKIPKKQTSFYGSMMDKTSVRSIRTPGGKQG